MKTTTTARKGKGNTRLVTLQHATPRRNVRSIFATSLQPGLAKGKLKAVWLHAPARTAWATGHVAGRHHVAESNVVILTVRVPRSWLRRNRRGVWFSTRPISPRHIVGVNGLKLYSPAV